MGNTNERTKAHDLILNIEKFPVLDLKNKKGFTDYIDFIKLEDVSSPIMGGVDVNKRNFIVFKLIIDKEIILQTLFQRYTNDLFTWRCCGHATRLLFDSTRTIDDEIFQIFLDLMDNKKVKIKEEHFPCSKYFIGKEVMLYDEKKCKAVSIIQKNWRICRYNPKYKMCENVQMRGLKEIQKEIQEEIKIN